MSGDEKSGRQITLVQIEHNTEKGKINVKLT